MIAAVFTLARIRNVKGGVSLHQAAEPKNRPLSRRESITVLPELLREIQGNNASFSHQRLLGAGPVGFEPTTSGSAGQRPDPC